MTLDGVLSECPNINDLPVLNEAGDEFYCAWFWQGHGNPEPIDADLVSCPTRTKIFERYLTSGSVVVQPRAALQIMEWVRSSSVQQHPVTITWSIESMALQEI